MHIGRDLCCHLDEIAEAVAKAMWRLKHLKDDQIIADLAETTDPGFAENLPGGNLYKAGIKFGWQYARLTWTGLYKIFPDPKDRRQVLFHMADFYGLVPEMPITEEIMRLVNKRPVNLFEVPGMKELLGQSVDDIIVPKLTESQRYTFSNVRYGRRFPPSSFTLDALLNNWEPLFTPDEEEAAFVDDSWLLLTRRIHEILNEHGLWTPLVWTQAERARRIELGWDEQYNFSKLGNELVAKRKQPNA